MPRKVACGVVFFTASLLLAATALDRKPVRDTGAPARARVFAQQLTLVAQEVSQTYMAPMAPGREPSPPPEARELIRTALEGLYEAAGVPFPESVRARIRPAAAEEQASEEHLLAAVADARLRLGDPAALRDQDALLVGVRAMTRLLDAHSAILSDAEVRHIIRSEAGTGVGLEATAEGGDKLTVLAVVPGGPAQQSGLRPGDEVLGVNDGKATPERWARALADLGAEVQPTDSRSGPRRLDLVVRRPGTRKLLVVRLVPTAYRPETVLGVARLADNSWDYWADRDNKLAHVRLTTLARGPAEDPARGTSQALQEVLATLAAQGMRGLILDLRWCPGGVLDESVEVARLFLSRGKIASVHSRDGKKTAEATEPGFVGFPMIVLVNGETSGGAELIAAALQDNHRALVAGQRTVGKASVQTTTALPTNGAFLKLTNGTFFRPGGKNLHRFPESKPTDDWGVQPDRGLEFRLSPDANRYLKEQWSWLTLRPGSSREALALDDPEADPNRQAALDALRGMLK